MSAPFLKGDNKMLTKKIILDTDIGCDCDDTAAMAVLHELANEGKCEILAVTHCCKGPYYAGCIDAINRYYGREDIPVGAFPEDSKAPEGRDVYAGYAVKAFPNRFANGETCPHTVDVLRKTLIQAGDGEVTIAVIGSLYSLYKLLMSGPDEISELSGKELIEKKVARTVVMAGRFHEHWPRELMHHEYVPEVEYNISLSVDEARIVCDQWPGELVFLSWEIGREIITCKGLQEYGDPRNPVSGCYKRWHEAANSKGTGRESWDPATVLYAVCPDMGIWKPRGWGRISVDEKGITVWNPEDGGKHAFLVQNASVEEAREAIDEILERDLERTGRK